MTVRRRIGLFAIAIGVLMALLLWSLPATISLGLAIAGVDDVTFGSIKVGFSRARVDALAIGRPPRQSVDAIEADYSLRGIFNGRLDRIRIDGLVVQAAYKDGELSFGNPVKSDVDENQSGDDDPIDFIAPFAPENFIIENSRIDIETPAGPISLPVSGQAALIDDRFQFDLNVPSASLTIGDKGTLRATLQLSGHLPLTETPRATEVEASGSLDLQATEIAWPDRTQRAVMTSDIDLAFADGRLTLRGALALAAQIGSLDGAFSAAVDFDDQLQPAAIEGAEASFDLTRIRFDDLTLDRGQATLRLDGVLDALRGTLAFDLDGLAMSLGDVEIEGVKIQRVLDLALDDRIVDVTARTEGQKVSVDRVVIDESGERVLESGWFTIQWPVREEPWLRFHPGDRRFELDWGLEIDPVRIDLPTSRFWARIEDLGVTLNGSPDGLHEGTIRIRQGRADVPSANLALAGIESDILLNDQRFVEDRSIPLTIRAVRPLGEPRLFSPLRLDAQVNARASSLGIDGTLRSTSAPGAVIDFTGQHDLETRQGVLDLELAPIAFVAGKLQPGDLSPILEGVIANAEGGIALDGQLTWLDGQLASDLGLLIDELGFTIGPARLSRINSVIKFDGLAPPTTPGDQLLSVGLLDVGLPLTDGLVSMQLRPNGLLAVDQLDWRLADGEIQAEPFSFGSDIQDLTLILKAEQLDLNALLGLTPLNDLTGEGRIDGTLPLTIGEAAAINDGELNATGPGVLRYTPSSVPGVLQAGGESVRLVLQALENFRYDALKITLDGRTDGATAIGLHLKGANPDLHDGHPVEFNLNLEGNLASLVQTNLDNYQIPDRIRERLQRFER